MIELSQIEEMFANVRSQTDWSIDSEMVWGFFFTDTETSRLEAAAQDLESQGYRIVSIHPAEEDEGSYVLHVEQEAAHTPQSLYDLSLRFAELAERHGLQSYDGVDVGPLGAEDGEAQEVTPEIKEDVEALLNELMPLANEMISQHGEFFPFGSVLDADGNVQSPQAWTGSEAPEARQQVDALMSTFRELAEAGNIRASALLFDCLTIPPGETERVDAVAVQLDHRDGYSAVVFFPYEIDEDKSVSFAEPFAFEGDHEIFGEEEDEGEEELS
jgi:hypothetical protein